MNALGLAVAGGPAPGAVRIRGFGDDGFAVVGFGCCWFNELPGVIGRMTGRAGGDVAGGVSAGGCSSSAVCAAASPMAAINTAPAMSEMRNNAVTDTSNP